MDVDPLGVFLITTGTGGERLLFRYPNEVQDSLNRPGPGVSCNPYALKSSLVSQYNVSKDGSQLSNVKNGVVVGFDDNVLANLLAASKSDFCGRRFELKVNDVIFVGFPTQRNNDLPSGVPSSKRELSSYFFNIVFALRATADAYSISSFQDLSRQLGLALIHEEHRCRYFTEQKQEMLHLLDDTLLGGVDVTFDQIAIKCSLGGFLKQVYEDVCDNGVVNLYVNKWLHVSFCVRPKIIQNLTIPEQGRIVFAEPHILNQSIKALRPYHSVLLLEDEKTLTDSLPIDASPALIRLIRVCSPLKNLQVLASDADLSILQVQRLVSSLVQWALAIIIYPLCESNIYMVSPSADSCLNSQLADQFYCQFPKLSLPMILAEFSLPSPLREHHDMLGHQHHGQDVQIVIWLLQRRLLYQVHTYVHVMPFQRKRNTLSISSTNNTDVSSAISLNSSIASVNSDESYGESEVDLMESCRSFENSVNFESPPVGLSMDDVKVFEKLCRKYFNGRHHLEEIMFYENLRRSQLMTIIDKFHDYLVLCQHEETDISYWVASS